MIIGPPLCAVPRTLAATVRRHSSMRKSKVPAVCVEAMAARECAGQEAAARCSRQHREAPASAQAAVPLVRCWLCGWHAISHAALARRRLSTCRGSSAPQARCTRRCTRTCRRRRTPPSRSLPSRSRRPVACPARCQKDAFCARALYMGRACLPGRAPAHDGKWKKLARKSRACLGNGCTARGGGQRARQMRKGQSERKIGGAYLVRAARVGAGCRGLAGLGGAVRHGARVDALPIHALAGLADAAAGALLHPSSARCQQVRAACGAASRICDGRHTHPSSSRRARRAAPPAPCL